MYMPINPTALLSAIAAHPLKVWVLAPSLHTGDENVDYYYDFSQSIDEYQKTFTELDIAWKWQPVTMNDYADVIEKIVAEKASKQYFPIVFNICDGDEVNGTPGVSVVKLLKEKGLVYTGADEYFYDITTSKIPMKKAFDKANVPTANWEYIQSKDQNLEGIFERLGSPIIVKPSVSGGSMGVGIKNVVHTPAALAAIVSKMFDGYRGWQLTTDGLIAESFINGAEYTSMIVGSYNKPGEAVIYFPVERVFHESLPDTEKFLSFDRLWEIYEEETAMPNEGNFYEYSSPDPLLIDEIKKISWDAYAATKGTGYTRVDIRQDKNSGKLYVLELNAQCGISEDEDYTSIGAILRLSGQSFTDLVGAIIRNAFARNKTATKTRRLQVEMKKNNVA
jgi:D-alanine-D-alanine ligase